MSSATIAPRAQPGAWSAVWQTISRFETSKLNPWLGLRNTIGVALPLAASVALGAVSAGIAMAIGALNVSFSDGQEPYLQRGRRMFAASVLVGSAVFVGGLCGNNNVTAVVMATAWAFAAGLLVSLSTTAGDLGSVSLVTLVVYTAFPQPFDRAVYAGLLAFGGGMLQTLLAVAFWPLRRYGPERGALANLFAELTRVAAAPIKPTEPPPASAKSTAAQTALAPLARSHSVEAERYRLLLSQAERMRLSLMLLGRIRIRIEREHPGGAEGGILDRYFELCSQALAAIGHMLETGDSSEDHALRVQPELESLTAALRREHPSQPPAIAAMLKDAVSQMDALSGQLRTAIELSSAATLLGHERFERGEAARPWYLRLAGSVATLRANLSLRSSACRHAIRLATCIAVGDALARAFQLRRAYWVPMTIALVLKPDFTATFSRGVLRLAGTFIGLVLSTALFHALPQSLSVDVALIAISTFFLRYAGPANYGILVTGVTALVVYLIAMTGVDPRPVMVARGINTAAGGLIALLAYWLWPTWERTQIPEAIARMLDAYRASFRAIRDSYENLNTSFEVERDRTRLAARLARSNLEASLDRLYSEPGTSPETTEALSGIMASSHRLVHALMALEAGLYSSHPVPARAAFRTFADHVELTLYYLSSMLRGASLTREALPNLREDHNALLRAGDSQEERYALVNVETDRITNSLNTLSEELFRWISEKTQAQ